MRHPIGIPQLLSLIMLLAASVPSMTAQTADRTEGLLDERVPRFEMQDGTLFGGVAKLSAEPSQLSFAFEFILTAHTHNSLAPETRFSLHLENRTIRELLNTLCSFDDRYTWTRDGTTVNVHPKETVNDPSYLMNRKLPKLEFRGIASADDALFAAVKQLPLPFEQIAVAQAGATYRIPHHGTLSSQILL